MDAKEQFNLYRFAGLDAHATAQGLLTMKRVTSDRIIVRVGANEAFHTRYGYGLHLDGESVLWLKKWQVSESAAGTEVLIFGRMFIPKLFAGNGFETRFNAGKDAQKRLDYEWWYERAEKQAEAVLWVN